MQRLSDHAYAATEFRECNAGSIATAEGPIVIDPPMRPTSAVAWRMELEPLGEVRYIINTEHHPDHTLGNHFFPGTVIAHEETRRRFEEGLGSLESLRERVAKFGPTELPLMKETAFPESRGVLPVGRQRPSRIAPLLGGSIRVTGRGGSGRGGRARPRVRPCSWCGSGGSPEGVGAMPRGRGHRGWAALSPGSPHGSPPT